MALLIKRQFLQVFIPCGHLCVHFTQFFREGESFHHALVHQRLFCWTVGDQLDALGLKLILSENKQLFSYSALLDGTKKWGFTSICTHLPLGISMQQQTRWVCCLHVWRQGAGRMKSLWFRRNISLHKHILSSLLARQWCYDLPERMFDLNLVKQRELCLKLNPWARYHGVLSQHFTRVRVPHTYLSSWIDLQDFLGLMLPLLKRQQLVFVALQLLLLQRDHHSPAGSGSRRPQQTHGLGHGLRWWWQARSQRIKKEKAQQEVVKGVCAGSWAFYGTALIQRLFDCGVYNDSLGV